MNSEKANSGFFTSLSETQKHIQKNAFLYAVLYLPIMVFVVWIVQYLFFSGPYYYTFSGTFNIYTNRSWQFDWPRFLTMNAVALFVSVTAIIPFFRKIVGIQKRGN